MAFLVVGVGLMRCGRHASVSVGSRFSERFTDPPSDRIIWLVVAGGPQPWWDAGCCAQDCVILGGVK